jgi:hypothetical protein
MIFILSTVLLSVFQLSGFYNKSDSRIISKARLELDCYSASQKCIATFDSLPLSGLITINNTKVMFERKSFGLFQYLVTAAKTNHDSVRIENQIGAYPGNLFENAIISSSPNFRASVSGNTKINGDILASSDKIKPEIIFGIDPPSKDYHTGKIKTSNNIDIKIFRDSLITGLFKSKTDSSYILLQNQLTIDSTNYKELFNAGCNYKCQSDLVFNSKMNFGLLKKDIKIIVKGRVIINDQADIDFNKMCINSDSVEIKKECNISNLLCVSHGRINIDVQTTLHNSQLFANDNISISGTRFLFPSVICLFEVTADTSIKNPNISIKSSNINGNIMLVCDYTGLGSNKSKISIDEKSKIQGIIYSENYTDLRGDLNGSLYTLYTWYYKEPTEYKNWFINMKVDRGLLDQNFVSCTGFKVNNKYRIIDEKIIF